MTEVTKSDLRWRKSFYEVTGYVDMKMGLAKTIARHREAISSKHQATIDAQTKTIERMSEALLWIVNHTPDDSVHHVVALHALGEGND